MGRKGSWGGFRKGEPNRKEGRLAFLLWIGLALLLFSLVAFAAGSWGRRIGESKNVQSSTVKRTPLPEGSVRETGYYQDGLGWIDSGRRLERGLRYFYRKTGAQPYLYLTDSLEGEVNPEPEALAAYAKTLYAQLFRDQGHVLLLVFANEAYRFGYDCCCYCGSTAAAVMDSEAEEILLDYVEALYPKAGTGEKLRGDRLFSRIFRYTARDMMQVQAQSGWLWLLGITTAGVLGVALADFARAYRKERKREERISSGAEKRSAPTE